MARRNNSLAVWLAADLAGMACILLMLFIAVAPAQASAADARTNNIEAIRLVEGGQYAEAERMFRRALEASHDDELTRAKIAQNLGSLFQRQDRYREAETMFQSALLLRQNNLPPASIEIAYSLNNLAEVYRIEGRNWEALNLLETAVGSLQQFHPDAPGLPRIVSNLALVRYHLSKFDEAEQLLRTVVASYQQKGSTGLEYGVALTNLGQVLQSKSELDEAAPLYSQAIAILEKLGARASGYLAAALASSGTLYERLGRREEARQTEERALSLLRPIGDDLLRITILRNLGIIAAGAGDAAGSLPYFEKSLEVQEKTLGAEHPITAELLLDYASAAVSAGNKSLSRKLRRRAKELLAHLNRLSPEELTVSVRALRSAK